MKQYNSIEEKIAEVRKKDKRYNYVILIVVLLMISVIASLIIYSQNKKNIANQELIEKYEMEFIENERLQKRDSSRTDSITRLVTTLREELKIIERDLNNEDIPRTDRATALTNVNLAQDKLNRITNTISDNTIVRYYKRKADSPKIELLIQSMKDPSFTLNLKHVATDNGRDKVNTIHYGNNIDKKDLYKLIRGLMSIGVEIKNIQPFDDKRTSEWKDNSIEIGYEPIKESIKSVTRNDILKYKTRNNNGNYNVRFYSYNPNSETKKNLAQFIKNQSYKLKIYPDWKKKPSFFSNSPTVFYYSSKSKAEAEELKNDLNKNNFGVTFKIQRGSGYGISKNELDNTFIVHYMQ